MAIEMSEMLSMRSGMGTLDTETIDQMNDLLNMNLLAVGLPECGNIRSTKRKDVRARIMCLQTMLKVIKSNESFKIMMKERGKVIESEDTLEL